MHEAFVLSTPVRRAVFLDIAAGEKDLDRIVAKNRLLRPAARRAAEDLVARGLVEGSDGDWRVTEAGRRLRTTLEKSYL